MKWSRERDYHAYRSYGADAATGKRANGGILAGLIGAIKAALQFIARPTPAPVTLTKAGRSGFSTLGARELRRQADCPFPTAPADITRARRP
jgi:hypothetical protein